MKKQKGKEKSVQVGVSPKAHRKMLEEGLKYSPRLNLREIINIKNDLPKEV